MLAPPGVIQFRLLLQTVSCATNPPPRFTIGGTVSGLAASGLVLRNNGADNLSISANGPFTFATALTSGSSYSVTVFSQPSGQTCTVSSGSGTVGSANVTTVVVSCGTNPPPAAKVRVLQGWLRLGPPRRNAD